MRVAIVGVGNLGSVLVKSLRDHGIASERLILVSRNSEKDAHVADKTGIMPISDSSRVPSLHDEDCVILAVKPQDATEACRAVKQMLSARTLVLSVMAGVSCETLRELLNHDTVARAMPNLGAGVKESATAYFVAPTCSEDDAERVQHIIASCGRGWRVDREELIDVATAVAGSGPAYLCWLAEQVEVVARESGIPDVDAHALVLQTFKGAVSYLEQDRSTFAELRHRVTSPNGTTAAALSVLTEARADETVRDAVRAALRRAVELGKLSR